MEKEVMFRCGSWLMVWNQDDNEGICRAIAPMGSVTAKVAPASAGTEAAVVAGSTTRGISS